MSKSSSLRMPLAFFVLLAGLVLVSQINASTADGAKGKAPKPKLTVEIKTASQADLLDDGALTLKLKAKGGKKAAKKISGIKVSAGSGEGKVFEKAKLNKVPKGTVALDLTALGETQLATCGAPNVKALVAYDVKGSKKSKEAKAKASLTSDPALCDQPYTPVPLENADRCDFLDPAVCLQPFPNDYFTVNDPSTETGKRLNLKLASMPANKAGVHFDPTDMNRADGFSPGNMITVKIPGLETPAAFNNSGLVPIDDLQKYDDPSQAVIVINADTGERQPIWAELDSNPTSVDPTDEAHPGGVNANPTNTGDVNLIIRPAENFDFGGHYIVALRNLKNAANQPIQAPIGFRVYRDNDITDQPQVEARRQHMNSIINTLVTKAGVNRPSLYMAWDFTVASQDSVTGRATTIRDDAFARLGDTDLADRVIQGDSPQWSITRVINQGDEVPAGERGIPSQIARRVEGTINVPCYLDKDGCPTGAKFSHAANGDITWNEDFSRNVKFRCEIPNSVVDGGTGTLHPAAVGIYGHGLLGTQDQLTGQAALAQQENTIWCAMDFGGFAEQDLATIIPSLGRHVELQEGCRPHAAGVRQLHVPRPRADPRGRPGDRSRVRVRSGRGRARGRRLVDRHVGRRQHPPPVHGRQPGSDHGRRPDRARAGRRSRRAQRRRHELLDPPAPQRGLGRVLQDPRRRPLRQLPGRARAAASCCP